MIDFDQLAAEALAESTNPLDLYVLERTNSSLLPCYPGTTSAERLKSYLKVRLAQEDHDHGHSAWIHFFEELLLHGSGSRLPWKGGHEYAGAGRISQRCLPPGEACEAATHIGVSRAGAKFLAAHLSAWESARRSPEWVQASLSDRVAFCSRIARENGGALSDLAVNFTTGVAANGVADLVEIMMGYLERCWRDLVRAVRSSAHCIADAVTALWQPGLSCTERSAVFLKGLAAGAIFIAVEMAEKELELKLKGLGVPEWAVRELAWVLSALAVTTAIWLASKLIDVLINTERAREVRKIRTLCESLSGHDVHEFMSARTALTL